jgi:hypothetical protein
MFLGVFFRLLSKTGLKVHLLLFCVRFGELFGSIFQFFGDSEISDFGNTSSAECILLRFRGMTFQLFFELLFEAVFCIPFDGDLHSILEAFGLR